MSIVRIGYNPATNMLPMFYAFDKQNTQYKLFTGYPAKHNNWLLEGKIDMAPSSAFAYGQRWEKYYILPDLSVSAFGTVGSISLFSKVPIDELNGLKIALSGHSATTVNLLKILLEHFYQIKPNYITMEPDYKEMLAEADAAMIIADEAIIAGQELKDKYYYDLGQLWLEFTDLPMTYALWIVDRQFADTNSELLEDVHNHLLEVKKEGLAQINEIIMYSQQSLGYSLEFWQWYFSNLNYDLTDQHIKGLEKYFHLCYDLGLLESMPQLVKWKVEYPD